MFENKKTSSGEIFSQKKYTAAHKTLPLHTVVKVTNLSNGRSVFVKVNDRCPKRGVIDLSLIAAKQIMLHKTGVARVKVEIMEENAFELLDEQERFFKNIEEEKLKDSLLYQRFEEIISPTINKYEEIFKFEYYVRLCSSENKIDAETKIEELPSNFKNIAKVEKVLNENYCYVIVGPFLTLKLAEDALNELKNTYKAAYIVKKK